MLAILSHRDWKLALRNKTLDEDKRLTTPLRKLIRRMPGLLILDNFQLNVLFAKWVSLERFQSIFMSYSTEKKGRNLTSYSQYF